MRLSHVLPALCLMGGAGPGAMARMTMPDGGQNGAAMPPMMDSAIFSQVMLDQLEGRTSGSQTNLRWQGHAWIGGDRDKLWINSEGFLKRGGKVEDGRHELLYDRAIYRYADLQAGVRADLDSRVTRTWGVLGVRGIAPLFFDYTATVYLSGAGHAAARFAVSYDLLITQRLILEPEIEANLYSKADKARGIGSGLAGIDAGLRLRYEISRKFAPYAGIVYQVKFGETARMARREGEAAEAVRFVFGLRTWF